MTPEEKAKYQYRFSGYQFNTIQLDGTGSQYVVAGVHPYYFNQPEYWANSHFSGHPNGSSPKVAAKNKLYPFLQNDENT